MAESVIAELGLDISSYVQSMQRGMKANADMEGASKRLGSALDKLAGDLNSLNLSKVASETARLNTSFHTAQQTLNTVTTGARHTSSALNELTRDMAQFRSEMQRATAQANNFGHQTKQSFDGVGVASRSAGAGFSNLKSILAGIGFAYLAKEAIELTTAMNAVKRTLDTVTGSGQAGAEAFAFVRSESNRLGTELLGSAKSFASLTNAAKGTAFEGEGVRRVFSAMGEASTALGLGTDEYRRILIATTQIMTKGKIQTEELLQLSEAGIPIFKNLADVLGITGEQLSDALKKGEVSSGALLLVAEKLHEDFFLASVKNSQTLEAEFRRLQNAVIDVVTNFVGAVFASDELKNVFAELRGGIEGLNDSINAKKITDFVNQILNIGRAFLSIPDTVELVFRFIGQKIDNAAKSAREFGGFIGGQAAKALEGWANIFKGSFLDAYIQDAERLKKSLSSISDLMSSGGDLNRNLRRKMQLPFDKHLLSAKHLIPDADIEQIVAESLEAGAKEGGAKGSEKVAESFEEKLARIKKGFNDMFSGVGDEFSDATLKRLEEQVKGGRFLDLDEAKFFEVFNKRYAYQLKKAEELAKIEEQMFEGLEEEKLNLTKDRFEKSKEFIEQEAKFALDFQEEQKKAYAELAKIQKEEDERQKNQSKVRFDRLVQERNERIKLEEEVAQARQNLISNAADNVSQILENVVENDWIGVLDSFFQFTSDGLRDLGARFEALGELNDNESQKAWGKALGQAGQAVGVAGAGVGVGVSVAQTTRQLGGNKALSGALGGAAAGATIGSLAGPWGAAIGAVVGAIAGALIGGMQKAALTFAKGVRTDAFAPFLGSTSDATFRRSAFGALSIPTDDASRIAGFRDLNTIAKLDNAIATLLTAEQRIAASTALAGTITGEISGRDFGEAAGAVMGERIGVILKAVIGGAEGERVAARFQAINPRGSPEEAAILADEFFGIVQKLTQSLDTTELSDVEIALKQIREEFAALRPVALDYGFSLEHIKEAENARVKQLRDVVDEDVANQLLSLKDPFAATMKQLQEEAEIRLKNVRAVGGDIQAAIELNTRLQRQAIQAEMAQRRAFAQQLQVDFLNASNQQQAAARLQLRMQTDLQLMQARQLGATQEQLELIVKTYWHNLANLNQSFRDAARPVTSPGGGRPTPTSPVRDTGPSRAAQAAEFRSAFIALTDPFKAAMEQMSQEVQRFRVMADRGIIGRRAYQQFVDLSMAAARANQALAALGGRSTVMDQLGDAFGQFINAGRGQEGPLAQFRNEMMQLNEEFTRVSDAAKIVGLSTRELELSYLSQSRMIKDRLLQAINQQLSAQIEGIESVNDFLRARRVDESLSGNIRISQAQLQFRQALQGKDAGEAIRTGEQLITIARQQFASSDAFFQVSRMVEMSLQNFAKQAQQAVENERARMLQQAQYQIQVLATQSNSLNVLRSMDTTNRGISDGISALINLARQNGQQNVRNENQLRNLALIIRNRQWK